MGTMNFRSAYKFDPEESDDPSAGGLLGLLQAAIERGRAQPRASFTPASNGYGGSQSDWLTRLAALPTDQSFRPENGQTPIQQQDPNFRQLMRVSAPSRSTIDPTLNGSGAVHSQSPTQQPPQIGAPSLDDYGDRSVLPSEDVPTRVAQIPVPIPGGRRPFLGPFPSAPSGGMSTPNSPSTQIPMPNIPDWWKDAWTIFQLYPKLFFDANSNNGSGGGGGDEYDCKKEIQEARKICTDAFANGWKSNYAVGPYKKFSPKPWNIQDCMRGFISERCGGNPVTK